jgi:hypothetical protein
LKQKRALTETEFITFTKMINVGRKEISRIELDDNGTKRSISKIYAYVGDKLTLIWEAIRSCFGSGW